MKKKDIEAVKEFYKQKARGRGSRAKAMLKGHMDEAVAFAKTARPNRKAD